MAEQASEGLLSPLLRRRRHHAAASYLRGRILDVGCGSGALAALVPADFYVGFDIDRISLLTARNRFPYHRFVNTLPRDEKFDTIVALAVIEHLQEPGLFLAGLATLLGEGHDVRIVLTTPHPVASEFHRAGAAVGLFSRSANEEHQPLLDRRSLSALSGDAGLDFSEYRRFLFGMNQLCVLTRKKMP
jgi:2-polyprenyl-3-methyl-5-hydroxy-6-metoxy-1,4-benzoquinol methylase